MTIMGVRVPMMTSLLVWAVIWEVIGRLDLILLIPPFTGVLVAMAEMIPTAKFHAAAWITLHAFLVGMAFSLTVGIIAGILMARIRWVGDVLGMWVNIFESSPLSAIIPVLMAVLGFGQTTVIVTVFLFSVWVIALDVQVGVRSVNPSLVEMARSFGASRAQLVSRILVLAALPEILAGIRLGFIRGVKGVVIGQLLIAIMGVGELFELYSRNFLMEEFWALILLVFAFAFLISEGIGVLERKVELYAGAR